MVEAGLPKYHESTIVKTNGFNLKQVELSSSKM